MRLTRLAALSLVLAVAGCSGSGHPVALLTPTPEPVVTPSATPTPTPTPTPSPSPSATHRPRPRATVTQAPLPPLVSIKGKPLAGRTIVLDPGHNALNGMYPERDNAPVPAGGFTKPCNTAGTSTDDGYPEHAYAWDVAVRAAALLRAQGARVVLTRPDDHSFGPCVNQRAAIANAAHADAAVSIHADGGPASGYGFHVIEPGVAPDGGNRAYIAVSGRLALALRAGYKAATGEPYATYVAHDGLDQRSDLAGLNLARVPAVFIECGNMRNASDAARERSGAFRERAAEGVDRALVAFLGH